VRGKVKAVADGHKRCQSSRLLGDGRLIDCPQPAAVELSSGDLHCDDAAGQARRRKGEITLAQGSSLFSRYKRRPVGKQSGIEAADRFGSNRF
jgi:hypothetical protein